MRRALYTLSSVALASLSIGAWSEPEVLNQQYMQDIVGGADISVSTVSAGQRIKGDNLLIRGEIETVLEPYGSVTITQDVGNGKVLATAISTVPNGQTYQGLPEEEGEWITNFQYPLGYSASNIVFKACNAGQNGGSVPCTVTPYAGATISNVDISNNVRVRGLWFHKVKDGNQAASISSAKLRDMTDWYANGNASSVLNGNGNFPGEYFNADYIYGGCPGNSVVQFRQYKVDTVDATSWTPSSTDYTVLRLASNSAPTIPSVYRNHAASVDPSGNYLHIYIVNNILGTNGLDNGNVGVANGFSDNVLAIEDTYFNQNGSRRISRVLAHEIGHTQGLYHISQSASNYASICNGTASSNLMCPFYTGSNALGDGLNQNNPSGPSGTQCAVAYGGNGSGIANIN